MNRGDIEIIRRTMEERLKLLSAEPRVKEALAIQRWLEQHPTRAQAAENGAPAQEPARVRITPQGRTWGGKRQRIVQLLQERYPASVTTQEIMAVLQAEGIPFTPNSVNVSMSVLLAAGAVLRTGTARYSAAPGSLTQEDRS